MIHLPLLMAASLSLAPTPSPKTHITFIDISAEALPTGMTNQRSMDAEFADLDADGHLDLVVACEFAPNLVLYNSGKGVFRPRVGSMLPAAMLDSEDIAIADFNNDGRLDLVFCSEDTPADEFYLAAPNGGWQDASKSLPTSQRSNAIIVANLNNDDRPDLIVGDNGRNLAWVALNNGAFAPMLPSPLPPAIDPTQDLELGDVNNDGLPDLIVANESHNRLLIAQPDGSFKDETKARLPRLPPRVTREADFGDIDGDGDLDLVLANLPSQTSPGQDQLFINDGTGVFTDETAARLGSATPNETLDIDLADIDADGDLDLVFATGFNPGGVRIMLNDGAGNFTDHTDAIMKDNLTTACIDVEIADLTGDGVPDLYVCNFQGEDRLYRGVHGPAVKHEPTTR